MATNDLSIIAPTGGSNEAASGDNRLSRLASLDFVRGFESSARHLSFTRAGAELALTQSAISRQIQTLEQRLGVKLFTRKNRRLELTPAGQRFYAAVREGLRVIDEAAAEISPKPDDCTVSVTTSSSFASLWLTHRLVDFQAQHPTISIRVLARDQIIDLANQDVDLAIRFVKPEDVASTAVPLVDESVVLVCSPSLIARQPLRTPSDLANHVALNLELSTPSLPWLSWSQWYSALGVPNLRPRSSMSFSRYTDLVQAAIEGAGIAVGRLPLMARILKSGQLVSPFDNILLQPRKYFLIRARHSLGVEQVELFERWLLEQAAIESAESAIPMS